MMNDGFSHNVPGRLPSITDKKYQVAKEQVERPGDVRRNGSSSLQIVSKDAKRNGLARRVDQLCSDFRFSLTFRSALEYDRKKANQLLEEVTRVRQEVEKIVEMLRFIKEYLKQ